MDDRRRLGTWLFWFFHSPLVGFWLVWTVLAARLVWLVVTRRPGVGEAFSCLMIIGGAIRMLARHRGQPTRPYNPFGRREIVPVLALLALGAARPAGAQDVGAAERAPVLAAVQGVLDAIGARDTAAARRWLQPGAVLFALPPNAGAPVRRTTDSSFVTFLAQPGDRMLERIWAPQVTVRGGLAEVWAPYDFHMNGRRTHCGIDSFTLVRGPAGWRVAAIAYTVETTGCAESPLGPPPA